VGIKLVGGNLEPKRRNLARAKGILSSVEYSSNNAVEVTSGMVPWVTCT
jgi:hypothetical protein